MSTRIDYMYFYNFLSIHERSRYFFTANDRFRLAAVIRFVEVNGAVIALLVNELIDRFPDFDAQP